MRYEVITRPISLSYPKIISVDTEYSELNIRKADLQSISVGVSPDLTYVLRDFRVIQRFMDEAEIILTWNGVVDYYMLRRHRYMMPKDKMIDAMLLEHLIDERLDHGLGDYALREENDGYKKTFWSKYKNYSDAPEQEAYDYEMRDGAYTYRAGIKYLGLLRDRMDLVQHVHKLQWALFDTEVEGVLVDVPLIERTKLEMSQQIGEFLPKLRDEFRDACDLYEMQKWNKELEKRKTDRGRSAVPKPSFNFAADAQIRWLVYDALACPVTEVTKNKAPKTDYDTLLALSKDRPELETLVKYKETKAVYSTFVEGMLDRVDGSRVYPHFSPNGTTTGRLSSSNPNFQNMPQEGVIRSFILPDFDCLIVGADFDSLEVGVEANITKDSALLSIMLEGKSKHDITATAVGMTRKDAKTLNFLCQYGGGVWKIQKTFGVSSKTAQEIYDRYWQAYSGVNKYKQQVFKELADTHQVINRFGRVRHFGVPKNEYDKARQERQAYSHMIQGPGAEMTNIATYLIHEHFKTRGLGRLLFPVHDEIVCSTKKDKIEDAKAAIVNLMESTNSKLDFKYPIKAKAYGGYQCWQKG